MTALSKAATIDVRDHFRAMRRQEDSVYTCLNYLSPEYQQRQHELASERSNSDLIFLLYSGDLFSSTTSSSLLGSRIEIWREKICEWCYQVVDYFNLNRETVAVALSYLDRYLATRHVNKRIFQLAAMAALYLAIKLYEPAVLRISSLIKLSRGYFKVEHIAAMEKSILQALSWRVHPPTSLAFARYFMHLLPFDCSQSVKHGIMETTRFLTELSVCDYFFITHKPSSIAIAALLNAIELTNSSKLSTKQKQKIIDAISVDVHLDMNPDKVMECRTRLREMYHRWDNDDNTDLADTEHKPSPCAVTEYPDCKKTKIISN